MDIENALEVFNRGVEATTAKDVAKQAMLPTVQMRPVGAQAVTVKRQVPDILQNIKWMADMAGEDWYYSWDVKDKNSKREDGKTTIEGPSVKLANDLARIYGNCAGEVWKVDDIGTHWVFHARFIDFETGYEYSRPFRQRKTSESGGSMNADRLQDIVFQIGASKAFRNCVVNALGSFSEYAMAHAKNALMSKVEKAPDKFRASTIRRIEELGYPINRIERSLATAAKDWGAREICQVIAQMRSIAEGMATFDELYPDPDAPKAPQPDGTGGSKLQNFVDQAKVPAKEENAPAATGEALEGKQQNDTTGSGTAGSARKGSAGKPRSGKQAEAPKDADLQVDKPPVAGDQQPQAEGTAAAPVKRGLHPDPRELVPGPDESDRVWPGPKACPECGAVVGGFHKKGCLVGVPADAAETCAHCGGENGTHFEDCPLLAKRPEPTDAKGNPIKADGNGEVIEDAGDIPAFLRRKEEPAKPKVDEAGVLAHIQKLQPNMSKFWHNGYVARAIGKDKTDAPQTFTEMQVRHWGAGWDARDMEEEDSGEEA